jgi:hypothetical protein
VHANSFLGTFGGLGTVLKEPSTIASRGATSKSSGKNPNKKKLDDEEGGEARGGMQSFVTFVHMPVGA